MSLLSAVKDSFEAKLGLYYLQQYRETYGKHHTVDDEVRLRCIESLVSRNLLICETEAYIDFWMDEEVDVLSALAHQGQYFEDVAIHHHPWAVDQRCHAVTFLAHLCDPTLRIYTGFSCHMFRHSWLLNPQQEIIEPTMVERRTYLGYPVEPVSFGLEYEDWIDDVLDEHHSLFPSSIHQQWDVFKSTKQIAA